MVLPDVQSQMPSKRALREPGSCFSPVFYLFVLICGTMGRDVKVVKFCGHSEQENWKDLIDLIDCILT